MDLDNISHDSDIQKENERIQTSKLNFTIMCMSGQPKNFTYYVRNIKKNRTIDFGDCVILLQLTTFIYNNMRILTTVMNDDEESRSTYTDNFSTDDCTYFDRAKGCKAMSKAIKKFVSTRISLRLIKYAMDEVTDGVEGYIIDDELYPLSIRDPPPITIDDIYNLVKYKNNFIIPRKNSNEHIRDNILKWFKNMMVFFDIDIHTLDNIFKVLSVENLKSNFFVECKNTLISLRDNLVDINENAMNEYECRLEVLRQEYVKINSENLELRENYNKSYKRFEKTIKMYNLITSGCLVIAFVCMLISLKANNITFKLIGDFDQDQETSTTHHILSLF